MYFVLEYSEGGEFSEFLKNNKNLDLDLLRFYAAEIVNIIDYLHSQGIAHRDLKVYKISNMFILFVYICIYIAK